MKSNDLLALCWRMVLRNGRRYRTVMIAISLGTIGFVMFSTLSHSVEQKISGNLELIGEATVITASWDDRRLPDHPGEYSANDARELLNIPHVKSVAPVRSTERDLTVLHRRIKGEKFQVSCVDHRFWDTISGYISSGRKITFADVAAYRRVCVLGEDVSREVFRGEDPVGSVVDVLGYRYRVIGVIGGPQDDSTRRSVFIPLSLASLHLGQLRRIVLMRIRVDNVENVRRTAEKVREELDRLHPRLIEGIEVVHHGARLDRVNLIMFLVKLFCYAALIAIFVLGKTGLTNVMLAAVSDRTREIGLRKALGATDKVIKTQFMIESVLVSLASALIGIAGGVVAVLLLKDVLDVGISSYILSGSIMFDIAVTSAIGVMAGIYPSSRASQLDIATALRFE